MLIKSPAVKTAITVMALVLLFLGCFLLFTGFDLGISGTTTYSGATLV